MNTDYAHLPEDLEHVLLSTLFMLHDGNAFLHLHVPGGMFDGMTYEHVHVAGVLAAVHDIALHREKELL